MLVVSLISTAYNVGAGLRAAPHASSSRAASTAVSMGMDISELIDDAKKSRLEHLEAQAIQSLKVAVDQFEKPVFPNAMIVGDCVITHLLHKIDALKTGKVKIMVVDTFHLLDDTMPFLGKVEDKYGFEAEVFGPAGLESKRNLSPENFAEYDKKYGANLWKEDIEQYDKVCKVEPFQRGLKTLGADIMINGRRRDHGAERAYIDIAETVPVNGGLAKLNPLAYWTLEDCFDYAAANGVPLHPSVERGYPSQGDAKDTVPVPDPDGLSGVQGEAGSVKWVDGVWTGDKAIWLDYGCERRGRFVNLLNKDGSKKTECGIHVAGAEKTFDRDLWDTSKAVQTLAAPSDVESLTASGKEAVVVVYAPWCQFCQAMEEEYDKLADASGLPVYKFRGDEEREFVKANLNTQSFPTINYIDASGKAIKYESEDRSVGAMAEFAKSGGKVAA
jgi:phosphoadenosine phosphosulfate reductase|uniref:Thioredoxin domain-containing protein n=1 Tax=Emiliania huxleyi TaxID=2903 RepID=A0A7S3S954_EMIHU|mmetsp:Transcript_11825/g.35742  ORF Transcript_11825/g.35742 Transcript_11825/m.35742 type:complete len:445 (+) Transcript_11825:41-1375(+)